MRPCKAAGPLRFFFVFIFFLRPVRSVTSHAQERSPQASNIVDAEHAATVQRILEEAALESEANLAMERDASLATEHGANRAARPPPWHAPAAMPPPPAATTTRPPPPAATTRPPLHAAPKAGATHLAATPKWSPPAAPAGDLPARGAPQPEPAASASGRDTANWQQRRDAVTLAAALNGTSKRRAEKELYGANKRHRGGQHKDWHGYWSRPR